MPAVTMMAVSTAAVKPEVGEEEEEEEKEEEEEEEEGVGGVRSYRSGG